MKRAFAVLFSILISGCATSGKIGGVQIGMTKEEVVRVMGSPVSVSAKEGTEYLNYKLSETSDDAFRGWTTPYYVRLVGGKVDSYGRTGDFDSTQKPTIKIETDEKVKVQNNDSLYNELKKIKELRDEGVLSEEEYQVQKKKILSKH